jgi:hypothetical protein
MPEPNKHNPNMFDARDAPALNEAFAMAWRALTAQQANPESQPGSIGLQCRIASTIIAAAYEGVVDPARMAKAAIARCASTPRVRLAN